MNAKDFYRQRHCGIYRIHNTINDMSYIGQSVDCSARWQQHLTKNKSAIGSAIALSPASFTFQILEVCSKDSLNEREEFYIQVYNSVVHGYNKNSAPKTAPLDKAIAEVVATETNVKEQKKKLKQLKKMHLASVWNSR